VTCDGPPAGRLTAIRQRGGRDPARAARPAELAPGPLALALVVDGIPLAELADGTALRIGAIAVVELGPAAATGAVVGEPGGIEEAGIGMRSRREARVHAGGAIRVGDPVAIESVPLAIEDALDLHPFRPADVADVVREYLHQAAAAGHVEVRLIHGRGRGVQREIVRRLLATLPAVASFGDAPPERGGWGATVVRLGPARGAAPAP
jgi:hypothetical protein